MSTFFRPYEGRRPYCFVSYSHRDSEAVLSVLSVLNDRKLRLWYDEGIPAGSDWPKSIEQHMRECAAVLFFLSGTALSSPNCYSEIKTAADLNKPLFVIRLDDSDPDGRWSPLLQRAEILTPGQEASAESTASSILEWKSLPHTFYRKRSDSFRYEWIGLVFSLLLLAAAAVFVYALASGWFDPPPYEPPAQADTPSPSAAPTETPSPAPTDTPVPTPTVDPGHFPVSFPDAQQEGAVRRILKQPNGDVLRPDLANVTELYFCGNMTLDSPDAITFDPDGTVRVKGAPVIEGKVSDLSMIRIMMYLEKLALIDQPLGGVPSLSGLVLLRELYLSGSDVSTVSQLSGLPSLKTLHLEHTDVKDLSPLLNIPSLETVTVSVDMLPLVFPDERPFRIILVP